MANIANVEIRGLSELVTGFMVFHERHLPFAIAKTLTDIAFIAKSNTVDEMKHVFDRPTSFTLNSLKVDKATKADLRSRVWFKSPSRVSNSNHYLTSEVTGGKRTFKKFEAALNRTGLLPNGYYAIPASGADIDGFGNMRKWQITQILAFFSAFGEQGYTSNMTSESRKKLKKGTKKNAGISYFAIQPRSGNALHPGIYKRIYSGFGQAIKPVLLFVNTVSYHEKLNIQQIADETYNRNFEDKFSANFNAAINSALPR